MRHRALHRRLWILAGIALVAGCSSGSTAAKKKSRGPGGRRPKGPKTMGNLLLNSYIEDLKSGPVAKKITAAKEVANMGAAAKAALPALQPLASHADAKLREAANQAIKSIKQ